MPEKGVSYLLAHTEKVEFAKLFGQKLESKENADGMWPERERGVTLKNKKVQI